MSYKNKYFFRLINVELKLDNRRNSHLHLIKGWARAIEVEKAVYSIRIIIKFVH